ncbi:leucine-rich repeat domain-containing protein [Patescibacteria group bacterium]|nr:MAG: leucine-rich repeat domain-containing protein [Patescibacteria group bacterium]
MKKTHAFVPALAIVLLGAGCSVPVPGPANTQGIYAPASATRLDLSGQGLERVPASVFDRIRLVELDLSDNRLTGALPGEIRHLRNLRVLDAGGNAMTGVPAEIGQLSLLETLVLSDNELTGLPMELGNLPNLRLLDLRGNDVSRPDLEAIRARLKDTEILE